jgi:NAD(P)-dependent dehydrogenase (short-subunit alcohol dehydrogenase family)
MVVSRRTAEFLFPFSNLTFVLLIYTILYLDLTSLLTPVIMSKVCLVVGGTGGLGAGCAKALASDYKIVVAGRNREKGDAIVQEIKSKGGEATFLTLDIGSTDSIKQLHKDVKQTYGRLDAAINGAGITGPFQKLNEYSTEEMMQVFTTNLTGVVACMQEQIRLMQSNSGGSGGRIVNFSSIYGLHGCKFGSIYSTTKHALIGLTKSAALEYSNPEDNILINCVAPGVIVTEMTYALDNPAVLPEGDVKEYVKTLKGQYTQRRFGELADVTRGVRYLLESPWVTGTTLEIEGGFGAK